MIIDVVVPCAIQCIKKLLEIFSLGFGTSVDSEKSAACLTVVGRGK